MMEKFLDRAAEEMMQRHGSDLSNVLVLMPNRRSCTYFLHSLIQKSESTVFAPDIMAMQQKVLEVSPLSVIDNVELIAEVFAAYKNVGGEETFDSFIGTAQVLVQDFDTLDMQMVDSIDFFRNLELLQSMKVYEPGEVPGVLQMQYRKFWEDFGKIYVELNAALRNQGKAYRGMAIRMVAENPSLYLPEVLSQFSSIYFIGFSGLNKTDEAILDYLRLKADVHLLWDADQYYVNDPNKEAGFYFRKYKSKYKIGEKTLVNEISAHPLNIEVIGTAKNIGQVKIAADILTHRLGINSDNAADTVVIVPDEKLLAPLMAWIPANIKELNITMGISLTGSLSATWLEILFRMQEGARKYEKGSSISRFYYKDVFDLLQHPFFSMLYKHGDVSHFISQMKRQNRVVIGASEVYALFNEVPADLFLFYKSAGEYMSFLETQLQNIIARLIELHRQGNTMWDTEVEVAGRLLRLVSCNSKLFNADISIDLGTFIAMIRESILGETAALEGEPVKGLQIMGLQESRALNFKNVIILSANEGIFPTGKNSKSYIPFELQAQYLTSYRERDANTTYLFYRLLQQAEKVFLIYNTEPDELGGGEKSRFIYQLQHELTSANPRATITESIYAVDPPAMLADNQIVIDKSEEMMLKLQRLTTVKGLSPSALNTFVNCSLQYYFRYIAGLKEQDDMEESMDAAAIGDTVHYVLEQIYLPFRGQVPDKKVLSSFVSDKKKIEELIRHHLSEKYEATGLSSGKNLLLFKVCIKLAEEFLKADLAQLEKDESSGEIREIVALEVPLEAVLNIEGQEVKLAGRADRIDKAKNLYMIADYKTSSVKKLKPLSDEVWDELFSNPDYSKTVQLLMYAWMYSSASNDKNLRLASGIFWLRENSLGYNAIMVEKGNLEITADTMARFEQELRKVLSSLLDVKQPFVKTNDEKRCIYCDFKNICNRN